MVWYFGILESEELVLNPGLVMSKSYNLSKPQFLI